MLRNEVAAIRIAGEATAAAEGSPATADPLDLLADLFGRGDARAGELARIADDAASLLPSAGSTPMC